jgi:hypothetical protein
MRVERVEADADTDPDRARQADDEGGPANRDARLANSVLPVPAPAERRRISSAQ